MPHFIIHCSENVLQLQTAEKIINTVHDAANATGLFAPGNIKARTQSFSEYTVGGTKEDFIHIFGHIMSGRTAEQKANLSKNIIAALKPMFAEISVLSINISDFDKATYFNQDMI
ncbi:MAG: 5-carboxymethyl-2-hydroxymuconate isomerase [Crocinitomix sp.]|jgi:5-carboxymethyl-2-hydroxymuconate isomerase